jgi:hypothetical protein
MVFIILWQWTNVGYSFIKIQTEIAVTWAWWPCHIAQAVSRRFPIAADRVQSQVRSSRICGGQSGTGAGFLRVLRFRLPNLIPPTAPHSSSSVIGAGTIGQLVADVPSVLKSHPTPRDLKKLHEHGATIDACSFCVLFSSGMMWNDVNKEVQGKTGGRMECIMLVYGPRITQS